MTDYSAKLVLCGTAISSGECPLMGWSGRAPAPPGTNLARGSKDKEHAMSQNDSITDGLGRRVEATILISRAAYTL
jgi:hypothetical protein